MNIRTAFATLLLFGFVSLGTSGCVWDKVKLPPKVQIETVAKERTKLNLKYPPAIQLDQAEWYVITDENGIAVFDAMKKNSQPPVVIGVDSKGYEALSLNLEKMQNHMEKLYKMINEYKSYYGEKK